MWEREEERRAEAEELGAAARELGARKELTTAVLTQASFMASAEED